MSSKHVALVGVTGVGKSTLVNVLVGSDCAEVANDAEPCTTQPVRYDIELEENGAKYSLWDTRGLNEAWQQESTGPIVRFFKLFRRVPDADEELRKFLRGNNPKINLILFCVEAKDIRINAQWKNYGRIYDKICRKKIKVVVVVTRMDRDTSGTDWRGTCEYKVREVVGVFPDRRTFEAVPTFERLGDTRDCRDKILRLISNFS